MARDGADFDNVQPFLEESRYCLVAQVMKTKIRHSRTYPQVLERQSHGVTCHGKHALALGAVGAELLQRLDRPARQGDITAVSIFRQSQMGDAELEIDMLLAQVQQLAPSHAGLDGEYDQRPE